MLQVNKCVTCDAFVVGGITNKIVEHWLTPGHQSRSLEQFRCWKEAEKKRAVILFFSSAVEMELRHLLEDFKMVHDVQFDQLENAFKILWSMKGEVEVVLQFKECSLLDNISKSDGKQIFEEVWPNIGAVTRLSDLPHFKWNLLLETGEMDKSDEHWLWLTPSHQRMSLEQFRCWKEAEKKRAVIFFFSSAVELELRNVLKNLKMVHEVQFNQLENVFKISWSMKGEVEVIIQFKECCLLDTFWNSGGKRILEELWPNIGAVSRLSELPRCKWNLLLLDTMESAPTTKENGAASSSGLTRDQIDGLPDKTVVIVLNKLCSYWEWQPPIYEVKFRNNVVTDLMIVNGKTYRINGANSRFYIARQALLAKRCLLELKAIPSLKILMDCDDYVKKLRKFVAGKQWKISEFKQYRKKPVSSVGEDIFYFSVEVNGIEYKSPVAAPTRRDEGKNFAAYHCLQKLKRLQCAPTSTAQPVNIFNSISQQTIQLEASAVGNSTPTRSQEISDPRMQIRTQNTLKCMNVPEIQSMDGNLAILMLRKLCSFRNWPPPVYEGRKIKKGFTVFDVWVNGTTYGRLELLRRPGSDILKQRIITTKSCLLQLNDIPRNEILLSCDDEVTKLRKFVQRKQWQLPIYRQSIFSMPPLGLLYLYSVTVNEAEYKSSFGGFTKEEGKNFAAYYCLQELQQNYDVPCPFRPQQPSPQLQPLLPNFVSQMIPRSLIPNFNFRANQFQQQPYFPRVATAHSQRRRLPPPKPVQKNNSNSMSKVQVIEKPTKSKETKNDDNEVAVVAETKKPEEVYLSDDSDIEEVIVVKLAKPEDSAGGISNVKAEQSQTPWETTYLPSDYVAGWKNPVEILGKICLVCDWDDPVFLLEVSGGQGEEARYSFKLTVNRCHYQNERVERTEEKAKEKVTRLCLQQLCHLGQIPHPSVFWNVPLDPVQRLAYLAECRLGVDKKQQPRYIISLDAAEESYSCEVMYSGVIFKYPGAVSYPSKYEAKRATALFCLEALSKSETGFNWTFAHGSVTAKTRGKLPNILPSALTPGPGGNRNRMQKLVSKEMVKIISKWGSENSLENDHEPPIKKRRISVEMHQFIQYLATFDPRLNPLLALVRHWANMKNLRFSPPLNNRQQGTTSVISDLAILDWLVICFLARLGIIPPPRCILERPRKEGQPRSLSFYNVDEEFAETWRTTIPNAAAPPADESIDALSPEIVTLAQKFFHYYGESLSEGSWVLNTKDAELIFTLDFLKGSFLTDLTPDDLNKLREMKVSNGKKVIDPKSKLIVFHPTLKANRRFVLDAEKTPNLHHLFTAMKNAAGKLNTIVQHLQKETETENGSLPDFTF